MKSLCLTGVATFGLVVLSACASTPQPKTGAAAIPSPPGKEDCLFFSTLDDWNAVDRERLIIYAGRVPYLATLSFPSNELNYSFAIGFLDSDHDGRICGHGFDSILLRDGSPDRISIASLQRLDKADAKAFLEATHPKRAKKGKIDKAASEAAAAASQAPAPAPQGR